jgi:hypothetical protein
MIMSKHITVTPAYGRDYKSAKLAQSDWAAGKDFVMPFVLGSQLINKQDADSGGMVITIRYDQDRKVCSAK